jgi:hypothetical protein
MSTKLFNLFITGCDKNTRWQLPWFKENFYKHNPNAELFVYDFDKEFTKEQRWFKKPFAMVDAAGKAEKVCWIDTDIEIRDNIEKIWEYIESNKLSMVEDQPWSSRRKETWHNSGVVAFQGVPQILMEWCSATTRVDQRPNPMYGDQDVLHNILREGLKRMIHISDLPKNYNTLRIDLIDNTAPKNIKMMHWTGAKGNQEIKRQIND